MAYSTLADVQIAAGGAARLVALADYNNDNLADAGVVDAAIAEADATINTYASKRFLVPFVSTPDAIAKLSARMAVRYLRRNKSMQLAADIEEEKSDRAWLEALASGAVLPGVEPIPDKGSMIVDDVGDRESTRTTTRERMKGYW